MSKSLIPLLLFLLCQTGTASELALARELAAEHDWPACDSECRRVLVYHPELASPAQALRQEAAQHLSRRAGRTSILGKLGALPIKALVGFYRIVVAQSIGSRCVLEPSCSTYSLQAARERGWLGIPMTGDRLIREPSVVQAKEHPVGVISGRTHYADPVSDHIGGHR